MDIYRRFRQNASNTELIVVGRLAILMLVGFSILWIPILEAQSNSQLFDYIQSVTNFLCPPIAVVFVLAIFWDRTTEPGAFWGLVLGLMIGCVRMMLEFTLPATGCGSADSQPFLLSRFVFMCMFTCNHTIYRIHYLHFALILAPIVAFITIVISLLTPPIQKKYVRKRT